MSMCMYVWEHVNAYMCIRMCTYVKVHVDSSLDMGTRRQRESGWLVHCVMRFSSSRGVVWRDGKVWWVRLGHWIVVCVVCMCIHAWIYISVCVCMCMHTWIHICVCVSKRGYVYVYVYVNTYMCMCVHTWIHVCVYVCVCGVWCVFAWLTGRAVYLSGCNVWHMVSWDFRNSGRRN